MFHEDIEEFKTRHDNYAWYDGHKVDIIYADFTRNYLKSRDVYDPQRIRYLCSSVVDANLLLPSFFAALFSCVYYLRYFSMLQVGLFVALGFIIGLCLKSTNFIFHHKILRWFLYHTYFVFRYYVWFVIWSLLISKFNLRYVSVNLFYSLYACMLLIFVSGYYKYLYTKHFDKKLKGVGMLGHDFVSGFCVDRAFDCIISDINKKRGVWFV